jgi:hypothetical protein
MVTASWVDAPIDGVSRFVVIMAKTRRTMVWLAVVMPSRRPRRRTFQVNSWTYPSWHLLAAVLTYNAEWIEAVGVRTCVPLVGRYFTILSVSL